MTIKLGTNPIISVTATANVIAGPADFEIETGASSAGSLSHMLTMMRKYQNAAITAAKAHAQETGMAFCNPYDDPDVIAGQNTLGLELLEDIDDFELLIAPHGGGGLLGGTALTIKQQRPNVRTVGIQASVCAPFIYRTPSMAKFLRSLTASQSNNTATSPTQLLTNSLTGLLKWMKIRLLMQWPY